MDSSTDELIYTNSDETANASENLYQKRNNRRQKAINSRTRSTSKEQELIETAESASFVKDRNSFNGYNYPTPDKSNGYSYPTPDNKPEKVTESYEFVTPQKIKEQKGYDYSAPERNSFKLPPSIPSQESKNGFFYEPKPFNTRPTIRTETFASTVGRLRATDQTTTRPPMTTTARPQVPSTVASTTIARRGSTTYQSSLKTEGNGKTFQNRIDTANSVINNVYRTTTVSYDAQKINTYSTARRSNLKTKETPFYTPTIPTSFNRTPSSTIFITSTTTEIPTSTKATNTEIVQHALDMMESLKELDIQSLIGEEAEKYSGQRAGLEVPPSSGPNALHSLALYFANNDNNNTKRALDPSAGNSFLPRQGRIDDIASVFLSDKTVTKYESLFPSERQTQKTESTTFKYETTELNSRSGSDEIENDLDAQHSRNPILSAAGTPQLRELAQVFTHALSAYLQDPEQFRKILSEIRPTEPPAIQSNEIEYNSRIQAPNKNELLMQESSYNSRATTTPQTPKSEDLEIFDFSDVTLSTRGRETTTEPYDAATTTEPSYISTTYYPIVTETLPQPSSNLADKTPASRLLSESLEKTANEILYSRTSKSLIDSGVPVVNNLIADEINEEFIASTKYPYEADEDNKDNGENDYFPVSRVSNSNLKPYGFDVKPENSLPITDSYPTALADTQAVPLQWGDEITTFKPIESNDYPTVFPELLPPHSSDNNTRVFRIPSNDFLPPNDESDESLQHAQSQSFVNAQNNIYTESKKSKTYFDYLNYDQNYDVVGTTRFGDKLTTTEVPEATTIRGHYVTHSLPSTTTTFNPTTTFIPTTTDYPLTTSAPDSIRTTFPDTGRFTTDSKTTLSYTVFLDPLTINDGLMDSLEDRTVTPSPNTYLPRNEFSSTEIFSTDPTTIPSTQRKAKSYDTTPLTIRFNGEESIVAEPMQKKANDMFGNLNETQVNHLMNVMKKADENKVVRRLILLLIQTCDDDDHNRTIEESRTALLNALIGMDNLDNVKNINEIKIINTRRGKSVRTITTTPIPITTYKSADHNKFTSSSETGNSKESEDIIASTISYFEPTTYRNLYNERETTFESRSNFDDAETTTQEPFVSYTETEVPTEIPTTTTTTSTTTTTTTTAAPDTTTIILPIAAKSRSRSITSKPKFRLKATASTNLRANSINNRVQKSLGSNDEFVAESSQKPTAEHKHADARALELLRSLYSLASRWG